MPRLPSPQPSIASANGQNLSIDPRPESICLVTCYVFWCLRFDPPRQQRFPTVSWLTPQPSTPFFHQQFREYKAFPPSAGCSALSPLAVQIGEMISPIFHPLLVCPGPSPPLLGGRWDGANARSAAIRPFPSTSTPSHGFEGMKARRPSPCQEISLARFLSSKAGPHNRCVFVSQSGQEVRWQLQRRELPTHATKPNNRCPSKT